jgi:YHS domain-containing protein
MNARTALKLTGCLVAAALLAVPLGCRKEQAAEEKPAQEQPAEAEAAKVQPAEEAAKAEPAKEKPATEEPVKAEAAEEATAKEKAAEEEPPKDESVTAAIDLAKTKAMETAIEVKLAAADKLDGKVDKIVTRCATCALGMDGKPEHNLETHGYTMYFCTEACKTAFEKNLEKALLAMEIPKD